MNGDTVQLQIDCDLSEAAVSDACGLLKVMPEQVTLVCAHENAVEAQKLRDIFRCQVVLVPREILHAGQQQAYSSAADVWCVMHGQRAVWSPGG